MNFDTEALALVQEGFAVFPVHGVNRFGICTCGNTLCKAVGKHPRFKDWQHSAGHCTEEDIARWHALYPNSNIGIVTNDLIVIDIDDTSCALAQELLPLLPATRSARTGRDCGMHWYYKTAVPHSLTVHALGGVDIRARGGFVVAPPSKHKSGNTYEWINREDSIAILSEDLVAFLTSKIKARKFLAIAPGAGESLVPKGQRHDYMRQEIFKRVVGGGMQRGEIDAVVQKYLVAQVEDGDDMSPKELDVLITGAYQKKDAFRVDDLTESGVAEKFVQYWQENLVYLESGQWYMHEGGTWKLINRPEVLFRPVRQIVYDVNLERIKGQDDGDTKNVNKFWGSSGTYRFAEAVVKFSTPALTVLVNDFATPDDTLPFKNGLFDLVTREFRPFRPGDHVVSTLNCDYDPRAVCPKWEQTLQYITGGDPQILRYHQQVFGYLCSTRTMRGVFFLVGAKSTGKTTLITTLAQILGERYAGTAQLGLLHETRSFSEDEDSARQSVALVGRRFVFMDETKKGAIVDPAKFKRIASRDAMLTARHLRQDAFQFQNKCKVVVLSNNQPAIDVEDDAAWDRVQYLPFLVSITKADRREGFKDELLKESAGIMQWCIGGFRDYNKHGFVIPGKIEEQVQEWQLDDNPLAQFVEEQCSIDPSNRTTMQILWERYNSWRVTAGYDTQEGRMKSAGMFAKALSRLLGDKITSTKSNGKRRVEGIQLKTRQINFN